jgi:hypothetical protein
MPGSNYQCKFRLFYLAPYPSCNGSHQSEISWVRRIDAQAVAPYCIKGGSSASMSVDGCTATLNSSAAQAPRSTCLQRSEQNGRYGLSGA